MAQVTSRLPVHPYNLVSCNLTVVYCFVFVLPILTGDLRSYYIGWLCVGINSSISSYFIIAYLSQWWLRTRYPGWFAKYNYILAAALDGGTQVRRNFPSLYSLCQTPLVLQVMVFILSFAVFGASGDSHLFPQWFVPSFFKFQLLITDQGFNPRWGANQNGMDKTQRRGLRIKLTCFYPFQETTIGVYKSIPEAQGLDTRR